MCQVDPCSQCPWKKEPSSHSAFGAFLDTYNRLQKEAAAQKAAEAGSAQSHHTGSPKLADLLEESIVRIEEDNPDCAIEIIRKVVGQLRAGA